MDTKRQIASSAGDTVTKANRCGVIYTTARQVSWGEFFKLSKRLGKQIPWERFETVLVVKEGGIVLGSVLWAMSVSRSIRPRFNELKASHYKDRVRQKSVKIAPLPKNLRPPILIIDDVNDTGETLLKIGEEIVRKTGIVNVKVATLFEKPHSKVRSDYCAEWGVLEWIQLPWER